jgi:hypothetical protein
MSDIDPIEYGKLVNSVENLERKVDAMEDIKGDFIPAIYEVLKTFSDYAGAVDC